MAGTIVSIVVSVLTCIVTITTVSHKLITKEDLNNSLAPLKDKLGELGSRFDKLDGQVGALRERVAVLEAKTRKE